MELDLDTFLVTVYCVIDDLYHETFAAHKPVRPGAEPEMSDSEVLSVVGLAQWQQRRSESAPGSPVSTVATVTVRTARGLSMDVMPAEVEGPEATCVVAFVNHMDGPATVRLALNQTDWPTAVRLAVRADRHGIRFRLEPASTVVVPPGAGGGVVVRAVPKLWMKLWIRIGKARTFDLEFRGLRLADDGEAEGADPLLVRRVPFTYAPR
jgi:hypothetical protein